MRKLILAVALAGCISPRQANATPFYVAFALVQNGVGVFAAITSVFGVAAGLISRFAVSALFSAAANALFGPDRPKAPDLNRELQRPTNLPPYRFAYGNYRVYGSYVASHVAGNILYACLILNSRPSDGNLSLIIDKRPVTMTGDLYDYATGATASEAPFAGYLKAWVGLGDQTTVPADILSEAGDFFEATDAWKGRTVLWLRLDRGPVASRSERWPRVPPEVEMAGDWSKVWDPRDIAQDAADPSTWLWSDNHALIALDALMQNPIQSYGLDNLWLDTFNHAADVADEAVALKAGGTEPRYRANGLVIFNGNEIEDFMQPILMAGMSDLTTVGGRRGIVPAKAQTPVATLSDLIGEGFSYTRLKPGRDLPTQIRTTYPSSLRNYDSAELVPYDIPGAATEDGGVEKVRDLQLDMVTSPTQAMRLRKIFATMARLQKTITGVAPPSAINLVAGAWTTVDLPAPFDAMNGTYRVANINPAVDLHGDQGVAMRCQITLEEADAGILDWDPATEEEEITDILFSATRPDVAVPGAITYTVETINNGGTVTQRFRFEFDPAADTDATGYEWQYRVSAPPEWIAGGVISPETLDAEGDLYGYLPVQDAVAEHQIRVRTNTPIGASDWVELTGMSPDSVLTVNSASGGAAQVSFNVTMPASPTFDRLRLYRANTSDFGTAVEIQTRDVAAGSTTTQTYTQGAATRFYWLTAVSITDIEGPLQGPYELTVTPDI